MVHSVTPAVTLVRTVVLVILFAFGLLTLFGSSSPPPGSQPAGTYAEAGRDANAKVGQAVRLDATGTIKEESVAPDDTFSVLWSLESTPAGSTAPLPAPSEPVTRFVPDLPGEYVFSAEAEFPSSRASATDQVTIIVTDETRNAPPNPHAGRVQYVEQGQRVQLDARRSGEPDLESNGFRARPNPLLYDWEIRRVGSVTPPELTGGDGPNPTFVAADAGLYIIGLEVRDWDWVTGQADIAEDRVLVVATAPEEAPLPMPDAGPDQHVKTGATVTLDGRGSRDAQNNELTWAWEITHRPAASNASLDDPASTRPSFVADRDGQYLVTLTVANSSASSRDASFTGDRVDSQRDIWEYSDRVLVVAQSGNSRPVAATGPDQRVLTGTEVRVDGSDSSDADGDMLVYEWYFLSTGGSFDLVPPTISTSPDGSEARFTPTHAGTHVLRLRVGDGALRSRPATTLVTVKDSNNPPLADAGPDAVYDRGLEVQLDGGASTDPDGDPIEYTWQIDSMPSGSSASLSGTGIRNPRLTLDESGDYELTLTVSDGIATDQDTVTLTALAGTGANEPPVADAGDDRTVLIEGPTQVLLDGSDSFDPDGDPVSYSWNQVAGPAVTLSDSTVAQPSFEATQLGTYTFRLVVSDGSLSSVPDNVTITVGDGSANQQPVADAGDDFELVLEGPMDVQLDGSGSFDPDGDPLGYSWSQIGGPSVTLSDPGAAMPTFSPTMGGQYTFRLVVNDGQVDSNPDAVTVGIELFIP